ncbi:hypothetical protein PENNAL_c0176G01229, partial [Penicillium nalgiovense]
MSILPGNEQPTATVKHPCQESYRRIADKKVAPRAHRVVVPQLTAPYHERQSISSRALGAQKLPGAPCAAHSKRQPERTGYNIMLNGMNGDCIDEDN